MINDIFGACCLWLWVVRLMVILDIQTSTRIGSSIMDLEHEQLLRYEDLLFDLRNR